MAERARRAAVRLPAEHVYLIKKALSRHTCGTGLFPIKVVYKLSNGINSFGQTGNLAGSIVLVIYSLAGGLVDLGGSS